VFWGDFTKRQPKEFTQSVILLGKWYREGKLKPHISAKFPLSKAADALKMMAARQVKGKVVLIP
jgi:NADPH2:quinone reductase